MSELGEPRGGILRHAWSAKLALLRLTVVAASTIFTVLVAAQVVMRYFLNISVYAIEELAIYAAIWVYFIGGAYGAHARGHISASLLEVLLPRGPLQQGVQLLASLISAALSLWMTIWTARYTLWSLDQGSRSIELGIPTAWVHAAMPIGLGLMALYFAAESLDNLRLLRSPEGRNGDFGRSADRAKP